MEIIGATEVVEAGELIEAGEDRNARDITECVKCKQFFLRPKRPLRSLRPVILSCLIRSLRPLSSSHSVRFDSYSSHIFIKT